MAAPASIPDGLAARDRIAALGRVTPTRVAVLAALEQRAAATSHRELEALTPDGDRVTIYRSLDWLVSVGLVHQVIDREGVRRFAVGNDHAHAHVQCERCGATACLPGQPRLPSLPDGWRLRRAELLITGRCPACV
jgi:Fur family ferric uptake transcriptional regulator